uniref:Chlororespiratory reduction31 n=1 Tax=Cypripedium formosanum TaxID=53042 RepID=A0A0F7GYA2_9ASPA
MAASSIPIQFPTIRNPFLHNRSSSFLLRKSTSTLHPPPRTTLLTPSAKFNLSEILGGRGLCNGEQGLQNELNRSVTKEPEPPSLTPTPPPLSSADEGFEKEMLGLTGGFPGGERGLRRFIEENPPPGKKSSLADEQLGALIRRPKPPDLPLLMPGMIVIVKNPRNPFYMYSGIVQRVTDGKAGVLFEGGVWDKLLTFQLNELERREKGPPMVNPKSAIHESLAETNQS